MKGDSGGQESVGSQGPAGKRGVVGPGGPPGKIGKIGSVRSKGDVGARGEKGEHGPRGRYGTQSLVGDQGDRGERDERGERGENGLQGDTSDVLSVLADHLPNQLVTRYGENMCFVKYHVSEDKSSIVESSGAVQTLRNFSAYHEPAWHFDANLSIGKHIQEQTYRKPLVMGTFWR